MDVFRYVLLGVIQGLTEFLPVSSSGHLVIFQQFVPEINKPGILLEVVLHAGTLLSVIYFYRNSILKKRLNYWILIGVATIPAVLLGLLFGDFIEGLFSDVRLVGFALLITGLINFLISKITLKGNEIKIPGKLKEFKIQIPLTIGLFQALAIIPGVSRSGSTIFASRKLGLSKSDAAEFSFLMSIPAIIGANIYELTNTPLAQNGFNTLYLLGFFSAFLSGVIAISIVLKFLENANFNYFSYYAFAVGLLVILIL